MTTPTPPRGRRRLATARGRTLLPAVLLVAFVVVAPGPGDDLVLRSPLDVAVGELATITVMCTALLWRRAQPLAVLAVTVAGTTVVGAAGMSQAIGLATFVALYQVGRWVADERWSVGGLAVVAGMVAIRSVEDPDAGLTGMAFGLTLTGVVWYVGRRQRAREAEVLRREREHAADARRAVVEERTRIARELHDVVAHRVSLMTVQAGAAKTVATTDPERAVEAMQAVEHAGRQALDELRHLLGVLRPEEGDGALEPQPGLEDLDALVARFRAAGMQVTLHSGGGLDALPTRLGLSAYRIVQEALTNVLKHAGPGARTEVLVDGGDGALAITVRDDGPGPSVGPRTGVPGSGTPPGGHGIIGMRERALQLGGRLDARPRTDGGFEVRARLPFEDAAS